MPRLNDPFASSAEETEMIRVVIPRTLKHKLEQLAHAKGLVTERRTNISTAARVLLEWAVDRYDSAFLDGSVAQSVEDKAKRYNALSSQLREELRRLAAHHDDDPVRCVSWTQARRSLDASLVELTLHCSDEEIDLSWDEVLEALGALADRSGPTVVWARLREVAARRGAR